MLRESSSEPIADIRHAVRVLVSRTAEHKDRLEALATSAEQDMRQAEREMAQAAEGSDALLNVLAAHMLGANHRYQTSTQLCSALVSSNLLHVDCSTVWMTKAAGPTRTSSAALMPCSSSMTQRIFVSSSPTCCIVPGSLCEPRGTASKGSSRRVICALA